MWCASGRELIPTFSAIIYSIISYSCVRRHDCLHKKDVTLERDTILSQATVSHRRKHFMHTKNSFKRRTIWIKAGMEKCYYFPVFQGESEVWGREAQFLLRWEFQSHSNITYCLIKFQQKQNECLFISTYNGSNKIPALLIIETSLATSEMSLSASHHSRWETMA